MPFLESTSPHYSSCEMNGGQNESQDLGNPTGSLLPAAPPLTATREYSTYSLEQVLVEKNTSDTGILR